MWTDAARVTGKVAHGAWIRERLIGRPGTVTGTVPAGFPAYARVLHPATGPDDAPVTWREVAAVTARRVHPTAQWHALIGASDPFNPESELWPHGGPELGTLPEPALGALVDLLAARTATPDDAFLAIWEGWGSHNGGGRRVTIVEDGTVRTEDLLPLYSPEEWALPRLRLPDRDHLLLRGPLAAVGDVARYDPEVGRTQSPSLLWPADRAWCVATEIDFDSTLVAGSREAVDAVLASPALEAWAVGPRDSLQFDADVVNAPAGPGLA